MMFNENDIFVYKIQVPKSGRGCFLDYTRQYLRNKVFDWLSIDTGNAENPIMTVKTKGEIPAECLQDLGRHNYIVYREDI